MVSLKKIYIGVATAVILLILGVAAMTSWYTVDESEQAVILTFGEVEEGISTPGLHFKLPWPIQSVEVLPRQTFSLDFGNQKEDGQETEDLTNDTKMITGDENIVLADLVVQWRITNPEQYLFNSEDPEKVLYNATSASLRGIIGTTSIDDVLTSGKAEVEAQVHELLTKLVDKYKIGISIMAVKLQDVELPNEQVRKAFTQVTDAREMMNTKINEANRYRNKRTEEAQGEKDAIISLAEGDRAARIEKARGDVARFNALYHEYVNAPEITRKRLVLETLDQVLPKSEIYIMNEDGNTLKYLPIKPVNSTKQLPVKPEGSDKNE